MAVDTTRPASPSRRIPREPRRRVRPRKQETDELLRVDTEAGPAAFLLRVRDDVMFDERTGEGAPPGALLTVDPEASADPGDWVLALSRGTPVLGRLVVASGRQFLQPINKRYPPMEVDDQVVLIGVCTDLTAALALALDSRSSAAASSRAAKSSAVRQA